jgi:sigma-E factor negative regulatory protein RseA
MIEERDGLKQKLSLLLDDELGQGESLQLFAGIEADPGLQKQLRRYQMISAGLRAQGALVPDEGFVGRVSAALAEEPTVLAPKAIAARPNKRRETMVTFALAASLAMVAVLVGKSLNDYSPMQGSKALAQANLAGGNAQASIDPEFRDYLVAHHETASLAGAQGMLPSVRLVSSNPAR